MFHQEATACRQTCPNKWSIYFVANKYVALFVYRLTEYIKIKIFVYTNLNIYSLLNFWKEEMLIVALIFHFVQ